MAKKQLSSYIMLCLLLTSCATGRDMASPHYIPEWDNRVFNFPAPSETSAGMWTTKAVQGVSTTIWGTLRTIPALTGNILLNAYYIPTWPFRWLLRSDKRLIVWHPLFRVGENLGSQEFSETWNEDLL